MSVRFWLLAVLFAVWLSAAAGFGLLTWNLHQQEVSALLKQVSDGAEAVNIVTERELDKRVVLARALASLRAAREGDFARFHEEAAVASRGTESWALLVSEQALLVNTLSTAGAPAVQRTRPRPLTDDAPMVVFVPNGPVSKQAVITVLVPVPGHQRQKYNVGVSFKPSDLQPVLADSGKSVAGLALTIIDDQHLIMARSRDPQRWLGKSASPAFRSRIASAGYGFAESTTLDGVASLTYLTKPNAYGWSVVSAIPQSELAAAAWGASAKALFASGAFLVFLLGIGLYGTRVLTRAVQALGKAADDLGNNIVPELEPSGVPEFDAVAKALQTAGVKAQEATTTLERRVEQAVGEAREAQEKLAHSHKLELVGRLTAGVAHDFNNLLQTITVSHHLLQLRLHGEQERKALAGAVRATSKAADLIKQLMLLGRARKLEPCLVNLTDVLLKEHELTSQAVGAQVKLSAELAPNLPPIFVDPVQLEMALLNLIFNARDALPSGGTITLRVRPATVEESRLVGLGHFIRVEVADNGVGMSAQTKAQAFEPFFTTKAPGVGTGMGLAQVHAFAIQSGGGIQLDSELDQGTRITLYLPVAPESAERAVALAVPPARPASQKLKILLVEDDILVASIVTTALEGRGCRVRACHNADEAVRMLIDGEPFDLLFTDVVMPGSLNGVELAGWARLHRPELAVVIATGYADNVSHISAPVVRKPYGIESLHALLEEVHQRHVGGEGGASMQGPARDGRAGIND